MNLREVFARQDREYAITTVRATVNTYEYWRKRGYSEKHSMDNAMKYAIGQFKAIVGPDNIGESLSNLRLMAQVSDNMVGMLEREVSRKIRLQWK